jgi:hypothetical protein
MRRIELMVVLLVSMLVEPFAAGAQQGRKLYLPEPRRQFRGKSSKRSPVRREIDVLAQRKIASTELPESSRLNPAERRRVAPWLNEE